MEEKVLPNPEDKQVHDRSPDVRPWLNVDGFREVPELLWWHRF
jgi:hypothetical protein